MFGRLPAVNVLILVVRRDGQRDPLPLLQRYAYANDNPANLVDPSGLTPFAELMAAERAVQAAARQILSDPCWKTRAFCKHVALVWKGLKSVKRLPGEVGTKISQCAASQTCTSFVGTGAFWIGVATGQPWLRGAGLGIMTLNDGRGCVNGSGLSCVALGADALGAGAASYGSYGVRWGVAMPSIAGAPSEIVVRAIGAEAFNGSFTLGASRAFGITSAGISTVGDAVDYLENRRRE